MQAGHKWREHNTHILNVKRSACNTDRFYGKLTHESLKMGRKVIPRGLTMADRESHKMLWGGFWRPNHNFLATINDWRFEDPGRDTIRIAQKTRTFKKLG